MDVYGVDCLPCVYETRQAFVAYIDCPCGRLAPFSKNQDAESQPEKVAGKSVAQTMVTDTPYYKQRKGARKGKFFQVVRELS